jgi:hypothetical protein
MKVQSIQWLRREVKEVALRLNITYDVFSVTTDEDSTMAVYMELSDQPESAIKSVVADAIKRKFGIKCDNITEAYQMVIKTWPGNRDHSVIQMY